MKILPMNAPSLSLPEIPRLLSRLLLSALTLGAVVSCAGLGGDGGVSKDPAAAWTTAVLPEGPAKEAQYQSDLPADRVFPVRAEFREEAVAALATTGLKELTAEEAQRLSGGHAGPDGGGRHPVLVRGMKSNGQGRFRVTTDDGVMIVDYSYHGPAPQPQRWPVVVMLDRPMAGAKVWVTESGAL